MTARKAREFQAHFAARLESQGWTVLWEVAVEYLHEYFDPERLPERRIGRIDLVATKDGYTVAYELDAYHPRPKSIAKLMAYASNEAWVVCRTGERVRIK
jgi:hypothetical protein